MTASRTVSFFFFFFSIIIIILFFCSKKQQNPAINCRSRTVSSKLRKCRVGAGTVYFSGAFTKAAGSGQGSSGQCALCVPSPVPALRLWALDVPM